MSKVSNSSARWKKIKESLNYLKDKLRVEADGEVSSALSVNITAELCVRLIASPSVYNYAGIKSTIENANAEWMKEFFDLEGLDVLLNALLRLSSKEEGHFVDALLQIQCVSCIKAVMNSQVGVQQMIDNTQFVIYLTKALKTENVIMKKQIYELLAGLCMYTSDGCRVANQALEDCQKDEPSSSRLAVVVNDLREATLPAFMTSCMTFINAIILSTLDAKERMHIRQELLGFHFLDILEKLREIEDEELFMQIEVYDDQYRCDKELLDIPEEFDLFNLDGVYRVLCRQVNQTKSAPLFLTILQSLYLVENKSDLGALKWYYIMKYIQRISLATERKELKGFEMMNENIRSSSINANGVEVSTQTENRDDTTRNGQLVNETYAYVVPHSLPLLAGDTTTSSSIRSSNPPSPFTASPSDCIQPPAFSPPSGGSSAHPVPVDGSIPNPPPLPPLPGDSILTPSPPPLSVGNNSLAASKSGGIPPPRPLGGNIPPPPPVGGGIRPPPPIGGGIPPPPPIGGGIPPPPPIGGGIPPPPPIGGGIPPPPPIGGGIPPPPPIGGGIPPPPPIGGGIPPPPPIGGSIPPPPSIGGGILPPPPGGFANQFVNNSIPTKKPFAKLKSLQWQKIPRHVILRNKNSIWTDVSSLDPLDVDFTLEEDLFSNRALSEMSQNPMKKEKLNTQPEQLSLLDPKESLKINIFLKGFKKTSPTKIIQDLENCELVNFNVDNLKGFQKIFPDESTIHLLEEHKKDEADLGVAEKFLLLLISVPCCSLRIDSMLMQIELPTKLKDLEQDVEELCDATKDILHSDSLPLVLQAILTIGNFLNHGKHNGNADGFKISSLLKIVEIKANRPGMNLMHFIVQVAKVKKEKILRFPNEMKHITQASKLTIDSLQADLTQLNINVTSTIKKIENLKDDQLIQKVEKSFKNSVERLEILEAKMKELTSLKSDLADYFCENAEKFKLEELLQTLATFCEQLQKAIKDHEQREKQHAKKAERAQKQKTKNEEVNVKHEKKYDRSKKRNSVIDNLLDEMRLGFIHQRQRLSSQESPTRVTSPGGPPSIQVIQET